MATAPKRESVATRGYDRREMAEIRKAGKRHCEEWTEAFDEYLASMVGLDSERSPEEIARRAEALADARAETLERRFGGAE